jgi:hypothetical protein
LFLLIVIGLTLKTEVTNKVAKNEITSQNTVTNSYEVPKNAQSFMQSIKEQNFQGAYQLLNPKLTEKNTEANFEKITREKLGNIELSSCLKGSIFVREKNSKAMFECLHKDKKSFVQIRVSVDQDGLIDGVFIL